MRTIFVVSDATGETAERVLRAALTQFPDAPVHVVRKKNIRTLQQVRAVVEEAAAISGSLILHTMVSHQRRGEFLAEARLHGVDSLDVLGPVMDRLAQHLALNPSEQPGLFQQLVEARSREIEAVEFAFRHDDGSNAGELDRAEVVLVGVSRTMKTPTMLYLAYRGWFAANVPLIEQIEPAPALLAIPSARVFCLEMSVERLAELRRVRAQREGIPLDPYVSVDAIRRELHFAQELCRQRRWRVIDTTRKSVEEAGREIMALVSG